MGPVRRTAPVLEFPFAPGKLELTFTQAAAGQDSRIIKVSTGGLDERHLWLDVCDDRVARAMARYGDANQVGAVLGEGGEFETLAIDGPGPLWKASIQVDDQDRISEAGVGGSSALFIRKAKTLTKETPTCQEHFRLRTPELLDTEFSSLRQELSQRKGAFTPQGQMLSGQPVGDQTIA